MGNGQAKAEQESASMAMAAAAAAEADKYRLVELDTERIRQESKCSQRRDEFLEKHRIIVTLRQQGLLSSEMGIAQRAATIALKMWHAEELLLVENQQTIYLLHLNRILTEHRGSIDERATLLAKLVDNFPELQKVEQKVEELQERAEEMMEEMEDIVSIGAPATPSSSQQTKQGLAYQVALGQSRQRQQHQNRRPPPPAQSIVLTEEEEEEELILPSVPSQGRGRPVKKKIPVALPGI
jgi:uncharacterized coiled-coil protein SlyX